MASNPKYGVTYKTSDSKTKTITGINLGTGSYSEEQITAFIGMLAAATNKEVLSVDITTANAIPPPEPPAPPAPDLIDSLTIEPAAVTIAAGDTATAEILITTDPPDAAYSLSAPAAPDWVSIDDTTLVFTPDATTTAGAYSVTVQANTADDQKEAVAFGTVYKVPERPSLEIGTVTENQKTTSGGSVCYSAEMRTVSDGELIYVADTPIETVGYTKIIVNEFTKTNLRLYGFDEMVQKATINATLTATDNYEQGSFKILVSKPKRYFWNVKLSEI